MVTKGRTVNRLFAAQTTNMKSFHPLSIDRLVVRFFWLSLMLTFCGAINGLALSVANADESSGKVSPAGKLEQSNEYVPGEVLVILADDVNKDVRDVEASIGGTVKKQISFPDPRHHKRDRLQSKHNKRQVLRVKLPEGKSVKQAIAEQHNKKNPRIIRVEPNYKVRLLAVPNDPMFSEMWALRNTRQTGGTANADIDAVSAWDITTGSDSVVVAVIDTGIDYRHPDLSANIWTNPGETPNDGVDNDRNGFKDDVHGYDFVDNDGNVMDEYGHGTHCAGTIAGRGNNGVGITGINWQCKLMACRFLDENGSGTTEGAIDAINYAVENGADILSNSWGGGGYSEALEEAIANANDNGVLFVAAAGNDGLNTDIYPNYPSCYNIANVIAVAATDDRDELAWFSNYGLHTVHLAAPGVSILSSVLNNSYALYSGTSMATPHVAGVAALLLANDPTLTANQLKSRLIWTGDEIESLSAITVTGRRLNAYNALTPEPTLAVTSPNTEVTWVQGFDCPIQWTSVGGNATVDIYLLSAGSPVAQVADDVPNSGEFVWNIPDTVAPGSDYSISIDDGVNTDESDVSFAVSDTPASYFTRLFSADTGRFDLSNKSLLLTPDGSLSRYTACLKRITQLPVSAADSTALSLGDDDSETVTLTGHSVSLYGTSYSRFYVGSNGYITFDSAEYGFSESEAEHFSAKRISGLFCDLTPNKGGTVWVRKLDTKAVVTWQGVPEFGATSTSTFQIEMFYDGRIRLSWLSVAASYGLVGISEGLGIPLDFLQADISKSGQCPPDLEYVEITGLDSIFDGSTAQFACIAHYDNDSTQDVTAEAVWSEDSDYADVDEAGLLTATDVDNCQKCTVTATYDGKSASRAIIITDSAIHTITIQKFTVKAGKTVGLDSIKCSGILDATAEELDAAENLTLRIYSGEDDYLAYEQTIDMGLFTKSKNTYSYKYKVSSGGPGGITSMRFNVGKNTFTLQAKNIGLTGLACPVYMVIDVGTYAGAAIAGENVVNGKKPIPVRLMSGYADTLAVTKAKPKSTIIPSGDTLCVQGTFTVDDDSSMTEGLTITWGTQIFIIPGGQFSSTRTNRLISTYQTVDDALLKVDFDFNKCTFKITIKQFTVDIRSGAVDFGLTFGNYDKTDEVLL